MTWKQEWEMLSTDARRHMDKFMYDYVTLLAHHMDHHLLEQLMSYVLMLLGFTLAFPRFHASGVAELWTICQLLPLKETAHGGIRFVPWGSYHDCGTFHGSILQFPALILNANLTIVVGARWESWGSEFPTQLWLTVLTYDPACQTCPLSPTSVAILRVMLQWDINALAWEMHCWSGQPGLELTRICASLGASCEEDI